MAYLGAIVAWEVSDIFPIILQTDCRTSRALILGMALVDHGPWPPTCMIPDLDGLSGYPTTSLAPSTR